MQVVLADASLEIKLPRWLGAVDALQVDLYDEEAAAPVLDTEDFYKDCRNTLTDEGCMTVNLFGRTSSYAKSVDKIAAAFGRDAIWAFKSTREGNTVVMAQRIASRPKRTLQEERADFIKTQWGLPADKWVRVFKPVQA
jgi:spermidine synthase